MANKNWIAGAIKHPYPDPKSLTAKAKKQGKTVDEFCSMGGHDTTTMKQCSLAKTLSKFKK